MLRLLGAAPFVLTGVLRAADRVRFAHLVALSLSRRVASWTGAAAFSAPYRMEYSARHASCRSVAYQTRSPATCHQAAAKSAGAAHSKLSGWRVIGWASRKSTACSA